MMLNNSRGCFKLELVNGNSMEFKLQPRHVFTKHL